MIAADSQVVDKLVALAAPTTFTLKDTLGVETQYTSKQVHEVKAAPPALADTVSMNTLAGFVDLLREKIDALEPEKWFIQVDSHKLVTLNAKASDAYGRRAVLIKASPVEFQQFKFGEWLPQEQFIIGVSSLFSQTDDKDYVLKVASCLTSDAIDISADDGFTQQATLKQGIKMAEPGEIKKRVSLAPFRTFPECEQPCSDFVFRAKQSDHGPMLTLVEADGGAWKVAAMKIVKQKLEILLTPTGDQPELPIEVIA
jgi:hypothetical protein